MPGDSSYGTAGLHRLADAGHSVVIKPIPLLTAPTSVSPVAIIRYGLPHHPEERPKLALHEHDSVLLAARHRPKQRNLNRLPTTPAIVQRSIAWVMRGNRMLCYRGTTQNSWWLHHRVAAFNPTRLITLGLEDIDVVWMVPSMT